MHQNIRKVVSCGSIPGPAHLSLMVWDILWLLLGHTLNCKIMQCILTLNGNLFAFVLIV